MTKPADQITAEELAAYQAAVIADIDAQHRATVTAADMQRHQLILGAKYQLLEGETITKTGRIVRVPPPPEA